MVDIRRDEKFEQWEKFDHLFFFGCGCPFWENGHDELIGDVTYGAKSAELVWRMLPEVQDDVVRIVHDSAFEHYLTEPYYAVHIRRGDKVFGSTAEARFIPTEDYCRTLPYGEVPVFIASDSIQNIEEVLQICKDWKNILYIKDPRYRDLRTGNFSAQIISPWDFERQFTSFKVFLAEVVLMTRSKSFVGTGTSGVWQLIYMMRGAKDIAAMDS